MAVSYAGVELPIATPEVKAWVAEHMNTQAIWEFSYLSFPGKSLTHIPWPGKTSNRPIKLGTLFWPIGASRWATSHWIVTEFQLKEIRAQCFPLINDVLNTEPKQLKISELPDGDTIIAPMYLLPPRRLSAIESSAANPMYLMTLVDERYLWWFASGEHLWVEEGVTTWEDIYNHLTTILNVPISIDLIDPAYLKPSKGFNTNYEAIPLLLDAVAWCVNQRIVRSLLGQVRAMSVETSKQLFATNLAAVQEVGGASLDSGGQFDFASRTD